MRTNAYGFINIELTTTDRGDKVSSPRETSDEGERATGDGTEAFESVAIADLVGHPRALPPRPAVRGHQPRRGFSRFSRSSPHQARRRRGHQRRSQSVQVMSFPRSPLLSLIPSFE